MWQIDLTWNLFTTPIVVSVSTAYIIRYWNKRDREREEAEKLQKKQQEARDLAFLQLMSEKEKLKEEGILERWRGYTARLDEQQKTLCIIKDDIALIKERHHDKVDWTHCHTEMGKLDTRLRMGEV